MTRSSSNKRQVTIEDLNVSFKNGSQTTQVLFDVNLDIHENEILAVVGESGSGKSVTSKVLMGLLPSDKTIITSTKSVVLGRDVLQLDAGEWSRFRGSEISMIFQEPMSSGQ